MVVSLSRRWGALAVGLLAMALGGCQDRIGPATLAFSVQPRDGLAGELIGPPVEVSGRDAFGDPLAGFVTIALDSNPCDWPLSGTLTAEFFNGTARFADLSVDKIGRGYRLRAEIGAASAVSQPFAISSAVTGEPLIHEALLCTKPNNQTDGESLTGVPEDDALWIADDERDAIYQVDRHSGETLSRISAADIVAALPDAGVCDDGDGDPNTTCSYLNEFEQVSYDPAAQILYLLNTVNTIADRAAIFRLRKAACRGCFDPQDWQPLPPSPSYNGIVSADGELLVVNEEALYAYDYATNEVAIVDANGDSLPVITVPNNIVGLAYDGAVWILTTRRLLYKVEWPSRNQLAQYDLGPFSIATPSGLEVVGDTIYVLEGDVPNPINVFRVR